MHTPYRLISYNNESKEQLLTAPITAGSEELITQAQKNYSIQMQTKCCRKIASVNITKIYRKEKTTKVYNVYFAILRHPDCSL